MRKILDKMFEDKKWSMLLPLLAAAVVYLLFLFFTKAEDKARMALMTPFLSFLWFWGIFLIINIQVKNTVCPEWLLNLVEFLAAVLFGIGSILGIVSFVVSGFQNYNFSLCLG